MSELRQLLSTERAQGWANEDGLITPGLASLAHAVTDHEGRPAGAIAVTFPVERWPEPDQRRLAAAVVATARRLTQRLQLRQHS
jgi:DNA-binding IclR family transcriptional regulator